jgi:hypothetical protein
MSSARAKAVAAMFGSSGGNEDVPRGGTGGAGTTSFSADNKCVVCNKTVYLMERLVADEKVYHKTW